MNRTLFQLPSDLKITEKDLKNSTQDYLIIQKTGDSYSIAFQGKKEAVLDLLKLWNENPKKSKSIDYSVIDKSDFEKFFRDSK